METFPVHLWCQAIPKVEKSLAPTTITRPPQGLSIRPGIQSAQLQSGAIFAHRNGNVGSQKYEAERHLCRALQKILRPRYFFLTVTRMDNIYEGYKSDKNLRNRFPQAQVHHQPKRNPGRPCHGHSCLRMSSKAAWPPTSEKLAIHQLEQLGTIIKQGWAHTENTARPLPIPNKHPSTSPSSGLTENSQGNPHPIP